MSNTTTARGELADIVASALHEDVYVCTRVWEAWGVETMSADDFSPAAEDPDLLGEVADAILAAGYRNPRVITTREELDDAQMVVVRTEAGTIANLVGGRAYCFGYEASAPVGSLALPVTVLWEREAES